ncbi:MAG: ribosome small subunit-dependent GTPase A [Clostridiales Family XIII bacterium]|jgi:ribosome biogenesis GTPase|nr:ribosome small subunit-dependent GTPase A [Clostridiales Family XIII bacterium]
MTSAEIVKATAGYYFADTGRGTYMCRARGIFKKRGVTPLVGDFASITIQDDGEGVIEEILERRNSFIRPPVANIDMLVVTASVASPSPVTEVIDRLLVSAEAAGAGGVVCINKEDLSEKAAEKLMAVYAPIYPTAVVSAKTGEGTDRLYDIIKGRRAAFAGASGVGKTSLLSVFLDRDDLETGDVSAKTGRGRHTTRVVETFRRADGTVLYDTPGFTSFDIADTGGEKPGLLFPEFERLVGACRFADCGHTDEPDCAVKAAVKKGSVAKSRYASYLAILSDYKR